MYERNLLMDGMSKMSIKNIKPSMGGNPYDHYACVSLMHDATGTPVVSPTAGGATLIIPPGAFRVRIKTAGTVAMKKPDGTTISGVATLVEEDGFVSFDLAACAANDVRYPNQIVLSAAANFIFDCMTPGGNAES